MVKRNKTKRPAQKCAFDRFQFRIMHTQRARPALNEFPLYLFCGSPAAPLSCLLLCFCVQAVWKTVIKAEDKANESNLIVLLQAWLTNRPFKP